MDKKLKKLFVATGILMAALIASIPLTTYADVQDDHDGSVSVKVSSVLTMEVIVPDDDPGTEAKDMNIDVTPNMIGTGSFSAKVSSNKIYTLSLNAKNGKTDMTLSSDPEGTTVNKIPGTGLVQQGQTSWGVKLHTADSYQAIPATSKEFYRSSQAIADETTTFDVGIAVGSNLLAGKYSSTLVITAANP